MEIFSFHIELIKELGFINWIKAYPVNPFTLFSSLILIGLVIIITLRKRRKAKSEISKPVGAATLVLTKRNSFNRELADEIKVTEVNGKTANWFFYKSGAAIYLKPGLNKIKVYAKWSSLSGKSVKTTSSSEKTLTFCVKPEKIYAIKYDIHEFKYILTEGDVLEDEKWRDSLKEENMLV